MKKFASTKKCLVNALEKINVFSTYQKPQMVAQAKEMLCNENISEEGFLGAQAVLLLNGML
jgi:hypothetical protein